MPSDRSDEDLKHKLDRLEKMYEDGDVTLDEYLRFKQDLTNQGGEGVSAHVERLVAASEAESGKKQSMSYGEWDSHHLKEIAQQARQQTRLLKSIHWWVRLFGVLTVIGIVVLVLAMLG